jgi:hypothetical protein
VESIGGHCKVCARAGVPDPQVLLCITLAQDSGELSQTFI